MEIKEKLIEFEDYMNIRTNSSIQTIKKYKAIVRRFLLYCNMKFTINTINQWLSEKSKNKNIANYRYALKHFLISIGRQDLTNEIMKLNKKQRKKVFNYIDKETMQKVINSLNNIYQKIAFLQLKTGARVSEIITLRAENIDFYVDVDFIQIRIGVNKTLSKRSKENTIYLSKKYEQLLRSWINRPFGYLFLKDECEHFNQEQLINRVENIKRQYNRKLSEAGKWYHIDNLSSHYLRHLFADYFLKAGGDPVYLKEALGHKKIDTTMLYVSIKDQMIKQVMKGMEES